MVADASRTILALGIVLVPLILFVTYGLIWWLFRKSDPPEGDDARVARR
jgi:hypothetical protein